MSKYKTDIDKIRGVAEMLLYLDIQPTKIPFIASQPFTDSWVSGINENGKKELVDLSKEDGAKKWREAVKSEIEKSDISGILDRIIKPYSMFFIKEIQKFVSDEDLGICLSRAWIRVENISMDVNVKGLEIVSMFKRADKHTLMTDSERQYLESLDNEITLYRGVTAYNRGYKKAMSWTVDMEKAKWFAQRFGDWREVWKVVVPKERILAYFTAGGEREMVVNLYRCNLEIQKIKLEEAGR